MQSFKTLLSFCSLLIYLHPLSAETKDSEERFIKKGRILYDIAIGLEQVENLSRTSDRSAQSYLRYLTSSDPSLRLLGLAGIQDAQKPLGVTGSNQKISLEYMLNDWLGIGGSLQNSFLTTYNLTKNNTELTSSQYENIQLAAIFFPELSTASDIYNVYGLVADQKQTQSLRTYDYDLTFHIPNQGNIDPYFRISAGRGFLTTDLVGRTGWSTGVRWKTGEKFFLETEIYQSRILSKNSRGDESQYLENGLRFGFGFFSTWPP
jgi:hypothetical protein